MFGAFFNLSMLAFESQQVIGLRLVKLAWGGTSAADEARLMISEKLAEAGQATGRLMMGASPDSVVSDYRETVQANVNRLRGAVPRHASA